MNHGDGSSRIVNPRGLFLAVAILLLMEGVFPNDSFAIPAFARKYDLTCTSCHTKPPRLNPFGEAFHMAGFQIPAVHEGEIRKKKRIGRIFSETELLNVFSVRAAGNLAESVQKKKNGETNFPFPKSAEIYLAGTVTDGLGFFIELEYESTDIEGKDDGSFEEKSNFGIGKEFFLMADLPRLFREVASDRPASADDSPRGGMSGPMIMGPMAMIGKVDPSTNFSYPTNRQFVLNVPGKVSRSTGTMERFGLTPYAFASKFYGIQTADGEPVEVTREVLYNTTGDLGMDFHAMVPPFMIQAGAMQGLLSGPRDVNQKKDPYVMARWNFGGRNFFSGSLSGLAYWGNDTAQVPRTAGSPDTVLIDWFRYGFSGNVKYKLLDLYGAVLWDRIPGLPGETRAEFDDTAVGLTAEGDFLASDRLLLSVRYDQLNAGGFKTQKTNGKMLTGQARYYLRDNLAFFLRDSVNVEKVDADPLRSVRNLVAFGADLDF
jgi:hypothetical protein